MKRLPLPGRVLGFDDELAHVAESRPADDPRHVGEPGLGIAEGLFGFAPQIPGVLGLFEFDVGVDELGVHEELVDLGFGAFAVEVFVVAEEFLDDVFFAVIFEFVKE